MRSSPAPARSTGFRSSSTVQDFAFMGGSLGMAAGEGHHHLDADGRSRTRRPSCSSSRRAAPACRKASSRSCSCRARRSRCRSCAPSKLPYIVVLTHPDDRRRHRVLCHARRCPYRRARCAHRFRRPARHRADDPRKTARRFPARRISAGSRHGRHGRASPPVARDRQPCDPHPDEGAALPQEQPQRRRQRKRRQHQSRRSVPAS